MANIGLYGSILVVIATIIFHFCPFQFAQQSEEVRRWMLISGIILAVLAVVMVLQVIRRTTPRLRQMDNLEDKVKGYSDYICNLYRTTLGVVVVECALIVLLSDTSLLMVIILLVLMLFLSYPNMYKMRNDLGLTDEQMTHIFGSQYISDPQVTDVDNNAEATITDDNATESSDNE